MTSPSQIAGKTRTSVPHNARTITAYLQELRAQAGWSRPGGRDRERYGTASVAPTRGVRQRADGGALSRP